MQNMKEETQTGGSVVIPNLKRKKKKTRPVRVAGSIGELQFFFKSKGIGEWPVANGDFLKGP